MRSIALFVLVVCTSLVFAQGNILGINGRFMVATMPEAKKELKVTKEQDKKLQEAVKEMGAAAQGGALPPGYDMMNPMGVLDPKIEEILDETQKKRLEEMFLWVNEGYALLDKKVAAALELTDEQKSAVKDIDSERRKSVMEGMSAGPSGYKGLKKKVEECCAKMLTVLTPEQTKKFEEMKGRPFKFRK